MKQKWLTIFIALSTLSITLSLIIFPEAAFHSSLRGLHTWWEVVFPSLLPFFIMAELLIGLGVVQFIGILFQPVMKPVFNVSGVGSFAFIVGMASGYPSGAKITASLRENEELTRTEAERLVSFTNAASPLFIFGAIAVGFFYDASIGILIAICHYIGNLFVGIIMRFYRRAESIPAIKKQHTRPILYRAFQQMHHTRLSSNRPFGQIMGDAVLSSVQTLLMVGGFIIFFSVFTTLLHELQLFEILHSIVRPILQFAHLPNDIIQPFSVGLFEITIGAEMIANISNVSPIAQFAIISFFLGFNGISIHAQVASIIAKTDIRFFPYFLGRILHAIIASALTIIIYPIFRAFKTDQHVMETIAISEQLSSPLLLIMKTYGPILTIGCLVIAFSILSYRTLYRH